MYCFFRKFLFILIIFLIFTGCTKTNSDSEAKINIITTTFPCYDAVRAVTGNLLNESCKADSSSTSDEKKLFSLKMLIKPGVEVHSYDPTPQDIISIGKCSLFVYVGGESDEWVQRIIENGEVDSSVHLLKFFNFVNLTDEPEGLEAEKETESYDEEISGKENGEASEKPGEKDEHVWTNPENEIKIVRETSEIIKNLAAEKLSDDENLSEIIKTIDENTENYIRQIEDVKNQILETVKNSSEKFIIMADRFPFVYFAEYYGINYVAAFKGCSTAVEASIYTISKLIDQAKEKNLPAVFYIELGNHKLADNVAESCGIKALELQSCQNVSKDDFENGETWVSIMKKNAEALKKGLN